MLIFKGTVQSGVRDFERRMTKFPEVFRRATDEELFPGTINVMVGEKVRVREDFRILGVDIGEPDQDLLFEKCLINEIAAYRVRPFSLIDGGGGHGDHVLEIACSTKIPDLHPGTVVEVTLYRD